jgi:type II secretory pathway predicted ATPase ExeA
MYEAFFGLSARPFQLHPDPGFHFWSKSHTAANAFLGEAAALRQGVIVLSGEIGAGKTTLVAARLAQLDPQIVTVGQLLSTHLNVKALLHAIAIAFALPLESAARPKILAAIETFLVELLPSGRHALLVIDEAQNLSPEALNAVFLLSTYPPGHRPVLQFLLLGQPELRERVEQNRAAASAKSEYRSFHLGPMEMHETRAYIEHRLAYVGWRNDPVITARAFGRIHEATGGLPRQVNALCNRLLLDAYLAQAHEIGAKQVDAVTDELRDELGVDALPPVPPDALPASAQRPERPRGDLQQDQMVTAVTARLDRLEQQVGVMLRLARAVPAARPPAPRPKI